MKHLFNLALRSTENVWAILSTGFGNSVAVFTVLVLGRKGVNPGKVSDLLPGWWVIEWQGTFTCDKKGYTLSSWLTPADAIVIRGITKRFPETERFSWPSNPSLGGCCRPRLGTTLGKKLKMAKAARTLKYFESATRGESMKVVSEPYLKEQSQKHNLQVTFPLFPCKGLSLDGLFVYLHSLPSILSNRLLDFFIAKWMNSWKESRFECSFSTLPAVLKSYH